MKWIDLPPVWLLAFAAVTWQLAVLRPLGWTPTSTWPRAMGAIFILAGVLLMVLAAHQMIRHRTTIVPHQQARHLVTSGIFAVSRNPIYLGDALVLAGLALWWRVPIALLLVPLFMWVIYWRFIRAEEARLAESFPDAFADYKTRTRRWV